MPHLYFFDNLSRSEMTVFETLKCNTVDVRKILNEM